MRQPFPIPHTLPPLPSPNFNNKLTDGGDGLVADELLEGVDPSLEGDGLEGLLVLCLLGAVEELVGNHVALVIASRGAGCGASLGLELSNLRDEARGEVGLEPGDILAGDGREAEDLIELHLPELTVELCSLCGKLDGGVARALLCAHSGGLRGRDLIHKILELVLEARELLLQRLVACAVGGLRGVREECMRV